MMTAYNGILNDNGQKKYIRVYLDLDVDNSYTTDAFIDDVRTDAEIDNNIYTIQQTKYKCETKNVTDETFIIGKEMISGCCFFIYYYLTCLYKPKFFVLTDKQEV